MSDNHIPTTEIRQHGGRHLAGIGPGGMLAQVLRPPPYRRSRKHRTDLCEIRIRHANRHFGIAKPARLAKKPLYQTLVASQIAVHLPVTDNEFRSHTGRPHKTCGL